MNFHFKQALEEAKYLKTSEGKAETFLRATINTIKTSIDVNRIEKIGFKLYGEGDNKNPVYYKLYAYYSYRVKNILRRENLCFSDPCFDRNEVLLVYDIIKNKLKEEGFEPEDIPSILEENEYHLFIKGFKFKIQI